MGFTISILLKIILYLAIIAVIHYSLRYIQEKFTTPKKRIIANDQLLYSAIEKKLKESEELNVKSPANTVQPDANIESNEISTTSLDEIPVQSQHKEETPNINPYQTSDMKEQLKMFLQKTSETNAV